RPAEAPAGTRMQQTKAVQRTPAPAAKGNFELSAKELEKAGHEQDYSWITGKAIRVSAEGGRWVLAYGAPYEVDRYGGSVVLTPHADLANVRDGDLICVHG